METSAKATSFPKWARLERDKGNYPIWRKHIFDVLQASGCEQAITEEFERLSCESSDSSLSDEDSGSDSDELRRNLSSLGLGKHSSAFTYTTTGQKKKAMTLARAHGTCSEPKRNE